MSLHAMGIPEISREDVFYLVYIEFGCGFSVTSDLQNIVVIYLSLWGKNQGRRIRSRKVSVAVQGP